MRLQLIETERVKRVRSPNYNYNFDKKTGYFERWGETKEDDPPYAPGPEILDIEISKGRCLVGCKFCSPEGTKVLTTQGEVNIEALKVGDTVISYDVDQSCMQINNIEEVYEREYSGNLITIEVDDGRVLSLTPDHLVFIKGRGWLEAQWLTPEMDIENYEHLLGSKIPQEL